MQDKKISKRNIIINVAVILVVTALAVFYLTKSKVITLQSLSQVAWYYYIILFLLFITGLAIISVVDFLVYRTFTRSMPYHKCLFNEFSGNLGSGITPFKSGHFPLMIYYQNRAGVPVGDTVTGLIKCQIIYSATSILVYTSVVTALGILGTTLNFNGTTVALWLVVSLGLIFHVAVFVVIVVLAFSQKIQRWSLRVWAKFLVKIKRLENAEQYILEKSERLRIYKEQITIIGKNTGKYIAPCLIYAGFMLFSGSYQYMAYMLITKTAFNVNTLFTFYTLNLASGYITNVIPIPGGVGTSEALFALMYVWIIPDSLMGAVLILWRVGTYYLAVAFEFIVFLLTVLIRKKPKKGQEQPQETQT